MADYGFMQFDSSGNAKLEIDSRLSRLVGVASLAGETSTSGTIEVPEFAQGEPFLFAISNVDVYPTSKSTFTMSYSGTTITWDADPNVPTDITIYYGVY